MLGAMNGIETFALVAIVYGVVYLERRFLRAAHDE